MTRRAITDEIWTQLLGHHVGVWLWRCQEQPTRDGGHSLEASNGRAVKIRSTRFLSMANGL